MPHSRASVAGPPRAYVNEHRNSRNLFLLRCWFLESPRDRRTLNRPLDLLPIPYFAWGSKGNPLSLPLPYHSMSAYGIIRRPIAMAVEDYTDVATRNGKLGS